VSRLAVIGLDAAELHLVEELMASGQMPHLARLRGRSAVARLQSAASWRGGRVWETFLTGSVDRAGGVAFDPSGYEAAGIGARLKRPFYAMVPGLRVLSLDVPFTTLGYEVAGAQVAAWGCRDAGHPRASRPAGLVREIDLPPRTGCSRASRTGTSS
jgi:hypothetical protein